ncbi:MAG: hypothetical protein PF508_13500 [Spirochaeta sp.]|nr:hypothetical protein [Spirochaeta sp.]
MPFNTALQRFQAQVLSLHFQLARLLPGVLGAHGWFDHYLVALLPIHRRGYAVLVGNLQRVDHTQNLVKVSPDRGGVGHREPDLRVLRVLHVFHPRMVIFDGIYRQHDPLRFARAELVAERGCPADLGSAYRREVRRVGKENNPGVSHPSRLRS